MDALSSKLNEIESIFQEYNIFKSIFVCAGEHVEAYYTALSNRDFPITKLETLHKFNNSFSRVLLLDDKSVDAFDLLRETINTSDVNMVIYLDDLPEKTFVENVPYFFLSR